MAIKTEAPNTFKEICSSCIDDEITVPATVTVREKGVVIDLCRPCAVVHFHYYPTIESIED